MNVLTLTKLKNRIKRSLKRSLSRRGVGGTIRLSIFKLIESIQNLSPSRRQAIKLEREKYLEFDIKYGVDTAGFIRQNELDVNSPNYLFAERYQPIYDDNFSQLIEDFGLRYEEYIFIDLGSGKGRAILIASSLPFKKIIGVEFSYELNSAAKNNVSLYTGQRKCMNIELICIDAAEYVFPKDESLVLFLNNPFQRPVMEQVADNITATFKEHPRRIIVIYFNPNYADIWDGIAFFKKKKATKELCVYDSNI